LTRRDRWSIWGAILVALHDERTTLGEGARLTTVAQRANVPYDRLIAYLDDLAARGLVTRDRPPRITPEGGEFLRHYRQWNDVLDRFGLG
jgi:predicted transcriptional regulator